MTTLLEVSGLKTGFLQRHKSYLTAVDDVSFSIHRGETLGIVGESGCGKSVTSLSVMQLLGENGKILSGSIRFDGQELVGLRDTRMRKLRGNDIAMIFQEPMTCLNPVHKIGRHICEPLQLHLGMSKQAARERALELLRMVGIPREKEIFDEYPHQLSGGMRQRVMIAISIACNPKLLIADEPTTALDVTIQAQILDLLRQIKDEHDMALMLITHDLGVVAETCDRVVVMYAGKVVEQGPVAEIFNHPSHPYTVGLLNSLPKLDEKTDRLHSIPGNVPSLDEMPMGCRFATRCQFANEKCFSEPSPYFSVSASHYASCWLLDGRGADQSLAEVPAEGGAEL